MLDRTLYFFQYHCFCFQSSFLLHCHSLHRSSTEMSITATLQPSNFGMLTLSDGKAESSLHLVNTADHFHVHEAQQSRSEPDSDSDSRDSENDSDVDEDDAQPKASTSGDVTINLDHTGAFCFSRVVLRDNSALFIHLVICFRSQKQDAIFER